MGLDFLTFQFLRFTKNQYGGFQNTLTLARQEIHCDKSIFRKLYPELDFSADKYIDRMLTQIFGSNDVKSIDYSGYEFADIVYDLNSKIPEKFYEKFDTVLDLGTLEHVYDISVGFENAIKMTRVGVR